MEKRKKTLLVDSLTRKVASAVLQPLRDPKRVEFETLRVDALDLPLEIDMVKIDVEGMELRVLEVSGAFIPRVKMFIIEVESFGGNLKPSLGCFPRLIT